MEDEQEECCHYELEDAHCIKCGEYVEDWIDRTVRDGDL